MPDSVEDLAQLGRGLSPEDRVRLLDLLLESLDDPAAASLDLAWHLEIERRVQAHTRGEGHLVDVEDVLAEAERLAP